MKFPRNKVCASTCLFPFSCGPAHSFLIPSFITSSSLLPRSRQFLTRSRSRRRWAARRQRQLTGRRNEVMLSRVAIFPFVSTSPFYPVRFLPSSLPEKFDLHLVRSADIHTVSLFRLEAGSSASARRRRSPVALIGSPAARFEIYRYLRYLVVPPRQWTEKNTQNIPE